MKILFLSPLIVKNVQRMFYKGEKLYGKGRYNYDKVKNITANNTITIACCRCKCEFDTTTAKHYNGSDSKCINKACK